MTTILKFFAPEEGKPDGDLYCIECFETTGLTNEKFHKDDESSMLGHLLDMHGVVEGPTDLSSFEILNEDELVHFTTTGEVEEVTNFVKTENLNFSPEEMKEDEEPPSKVANRSSAVWSYFETIDNRVICLLCQSEGNLHFYTTNSSTSNLRKHLKSVHKINLDNFPKMEKKKKTKVRKKATGSRVWRYFSKIMVTSGDGGIMNQEDYVFCIKCLEQKIQHKYKLTSSTGTLKSHLNSVHGIVLDNEDDSQNLEMFHEETIFEFLEVPDCVVKRGGRQSTARLYYEAQPDDLDHIYCNICLKEGNLHKYAKTTSTTALKSHLIQIHRINPTNDAGNEVNYETQKIAPDASVEISPETLKKAEEISKIQTRKIRTYFITIADRETVYCIFCIKKMIKKPYNFRTSTTVLRKHLKTTHSLDLLALFENNEPEQFPTKDETISRKKRKGSGSVWKYFSEKENDETHIYCNLCWNAPIREVQKYAVTTSSAGLKRHLRTRHKIFLQNRGEEVEEVDYLIEEEDEDEEESLPGPELKLEKQSCRVCDTEDSEFTKFGDFLDHQASELTFQDLYEFVTGITLNPDELICLTCKENLKISYNFKEMALKKENEYLQENPSKKLKYTILTVTKTEADENSQMEEFLDEIYLDEEEGDKR